MISGDRSPGHFQHGDSKGNLIWDPWNGTNESGKTVSRIDEVYIRRREDEK